MRLSDVIRTNPEPLEISAYLAFVAEVFSTPKYLEEIYHG